MVRYIRDTTGRFAERPYYKPEELDQECESIMVGFLRSLYREALDAYATLADTTPAQVHWGHVGTITEVVRHLKEIAV